MKQKMVIKVELCCEKCRSEARKIAAAAHGVSSVALEGDDKDKVMVVGDDVDAAELACSLRKKFDCVKLLTVEEVKPQKDDGKKPEGEGKKDGKEDKKEEPKPTPPACCCRPCYPPAHCDLYKVVYDPNPTLACTLM